MGNSNPISPEQWNDASWPPDPTPPLGNNLEPRRTPGITHRAYALWELLLDFRTDAKLLPPGELSRRCTQLIDFVESVEKIAADQKAERCQTPKNCFHYALCSESGQCVDSLNEPTTYTMPPPNWVAFCDGNKSQVARFDPVQQALLTATANLVSRKRVPSDFDWVALPCGYRVLFFNARTLAELQKLPIIMGLSAESQIRVSVDWETQEHLSHIPGSCAGQGGL